MKTVTLTLSALLCTLPLAARAQTPDALPDAPSTVAHEAPPTQPTGPIAVIDTTMGRLTCQLYDKEAPNTVANFIGLANGTKPWTDPVTSEKVTGKPFYDGTTFHRVIPDFMIQGGDRLGTGAGDPGYYFNDEFSPALRFDIPGRLAMANSGPNTNGSQFFITEAPVPQLNGIHTIFGQCDPHSVLLASSIARVERNNQDKPITPVVINKITIVPAGQQPTTQPGVIPPGPQNIIPQGATPQTHPTSPAPPPL